MRSRTPTCTPARATTGSTSRRWPPCRSTGRPDYLFGDLTLIGGTLNIDAGTGRQTLMISDEAGQADPNGADHP